MPSGALPPDVRRLLEARTEARDASDWARADALREELHDLGWQVEDGPDGSTARPILAAAHVDLTAVQQDNPVDQSQP